MKEVRVDTGVEGLNNILRGGFEPGSVVLFSGGPGTGKTLMSLQFLVEGAKKGSKGLFISFEERPDSLRRDARSLGWDLEEYEDEGLIEIKYFSPYEYEDLLENLGDMIAGGEYQRIAIDTISVLSLYLEDTFKIRKKLHGLVSTIRDAGATAVITAEVKSEPPLESSEVSGSYSRASVEEFVVDGVILLHYAGLGGGYDRTLQVLKMRRTDHKKGLFPMRIQEGGIEVRAESR